MADRLDLQAIRAAAEVLAQRTPRWDRAADWTERRSRAEAVIWTAWTVIAVVVGWFINLWGHRR